MSLNLLISFAYLDMIMFTLFSHKNRLTLEMFRKTLKTLQVKPKAIVKLVYDELCSWQLWNDGDLGSYI